MVALLRGINVGGHNKLPMADLRALAEGCGLEQVRSYIQSGNLVFEAPDGMGDTGEVAAALRAAVADATSIDPSVMVRTRAELDDVVAANPFLDRDDEPKHHHVGFVEGDPQALVAELDLDSYEPEAVAVGDRHVWLHLPDGMGRSKLAVDLMKRPEPPVTVRNWRTTIRMRDMAAEAEAAD